MESNYSIKDKDNLVNYNAWSGTDFLKNANGFTNAICIESSNEWNSNGDCSLKLIRKSGTYNEYSTLYNISLAKNNYIFSCRLYSPQAIGEIIIVSNEGNIHTSYPSNNQFQLITITVTNQSIGNIRFVNWGNIGDSVYIDDVKLIIQ